MSNFRKIPVEDLEHIRESAFYRLADKQLLRQKYGVSSSTADRVFWKLGLIHSDDRLISIAKRYVNGDRVCLLAAESGVSTANIHAYLRRHKIPTRGTTYTCDFDFFDNIDTEEKAYFLGFIYADGCLHKNTMKLALATKDRNILEKLKTSMMANHPIHDTVVFSSFTPVGGGLVSVLEVTHKKIRASLQKHGITERKTETCTFPQLSQDLVRHFVRGYFDGDGGICIYHNEKEGAKFQVSLCGTPSFLASIRMIFQSVFRTDESLGSKQRNTNGHLCKRHKESKSEVLQLNYSGINSVRTLLKYMYDDSKVSLDRKHRLYLEICK